MAASAREGEAEELRVDPNFELLAILLALALQWEDAERFLEVYDHVVPKSMSGSEVESIKDRARELSELPGETLLELKTEHESDAALLPPSLAGSLGRFVSRRIASSQHQWDSATDDDDDAAGRGKFLSRSGALLSRRLKAGPSGVLRDEGLGEGQGRGTSSPPDDSGGDRSRVETGSQAGVSYVGPERSPPECAESLDWRQGSAPPSDDKSLAAGDRDSRLTKNGWSSSSGGSMESATAHSKATATAVKQPKKLSHLKAGAIPSGLDRQTLVNGTAVSANSRSPAATADKDRHSVKAKPPQAGPPSGPPKSKTGVGKVANCSLPHASTNSHSDDLGASDDCTAEEQTALIPKSPPSGSAVAAASPPFKSLEDFGRSIDELLPSGPPAKFTCPPPLFLSKTTATLQAPDSGMAAKAETKYGTIPYSDVADSTMTAKDGAHRLKETAPTLTNHHLPDAAAVADSVRLHSHPFSTSEVPSSVNRSMAVNVFSSGGEASDSLDKDEVEGGLSGVTAQGDAAKKKKKKGKKKKSSGIGAETVYANNIKLPVGAPPLLHSSSELRHRHQTWDSQTAGQSARAAVAKLAGESSSGESGRHPPPMTSSDSVTSSGESSTDGGTGPNDVSSRKPRNSDTTPACYTVQASGSKNSTIATGKSALNNSKENRAVENLLTNPQSVCADRPVADVQLHAVGQAGPPCRPATKTPSVQQLHQSQAVRSDPSDSDSDRVDVKLCARGEVVPPEPPTAAAAAASKPHSPSQPTETNADSPADVDDDFIKVESKKRSSMRSKKRSYNYGYADNNPRFTPFQGRYTSYMDQDRDHYHRSRGVLTAGLRKSSSEPAGMSELGDKDAEEADPARAKPKNLSESAAKTDADAATSPAQSEAANPVAPRSEFSYASKVKSNMKASSLPPKLSPQALLDYGDDEQPDKPTKSDNSPSPANVSMVLESKAHPVVKSVLDKNGPLPGEKTDSATTNTAREQGTKNNVRTETPDASQETEPAAGDGAVLSPGRSFQRSSSVDTNEATKKVSFDDNSIRRTVSPQGPEASVPYLDLTYAACLKGQRPAVSKPVAAGQSPLPVDTQQQHQQPPIAGLRDLRSQPLGQKPQERESHVTTRASIVLSTNPSPAAGDATSRRSLQTVPASASADSKAADQPASSAPAPPLPPRGSAASPTPSQGSSASRTTTTPHPTFDLEPQGNFDITFGSVIVGKVGYEILGEGRASAAERGSPIAELLSKAPMTARVLTPPGLTCAELEQSIMSRDSSLPAGPAKPADAAAATPATSAGVSFGKFDGGWEIAAALRATEDGASDFNHLEVATMLMKEWRRTQEEILQNKVLVIE